MFLTQMQLDLNNRKTLIALASPAKIHGEVESAFTGSRKRNLWRVDSREGKKFLLILSEEKPDLTHAAAQLAPHGEIWQTKDYNVLLEKIEDGSRWRFRLCANPTYSIVEKNGERGRVCAHSTSEHQLKWLLSRSEKHGFLLKPDEFNVTNVKWYRFKKGISRNMVTFLAVTYEGILEVRDSELFRNALCCGIGRGKAYGAGLMTIVREKA